MVGETSSSENLDETPGAVAQRQFEADMNKDATCSELVVNTQPADADEEGFGDPTPPSRDASMEEKRAYSRAVYEYSKNLLTHLQSISDLKGEELWIEYTCSFRKETINAMTGTLQIDWARFLRSKGVHVMMKRGTKRSKALQYCLEAEEFIPCNPNSSDESNIAQNTENQQQDDLNSEQAYQERPKEPDKIPDVTRNDEKNEPNRDSRKPATTRTSTPRTSTSNESSYSARTSLQSLMKAYSSEKRYSGSFVEDFEGAVEKFNTYCQLLELNDEEKAKGFPIMLTGAAFAHYSRQFAKKNLTYQELVDAFRAWYTSEEQKKRLLNIWQTPSLTRELQNAPEKSELEVFQKLSENLVKVQNQLHSDYHHDRFLRDQLIRAADIPHLQHSLNDKVPSTAQEAMHRIANRLSSEPRSAGANLAEEDEDQAHYGIGLKFGGKARKPLKGSAHKNSKKKKLSRLLASAKGCYVCGRDHRARQAHSSKEILDAIERIKRENPSALFSVDEITDIQYALVSSMPEDSDEHTDDADTDSDEDQVHYVSLNSQDELGCSVQKHFANIAFVHGRSFASDLKTEMKSIEAALSVGESAGFNGIIMDTAANRSSVMSFSQYKAYCDEFKIPMQINRTELKTIRGLNSKNPAIGTASIAIPFYDLDIWIDVKFRIMEFDCPSLLSMKDMVDNGLDISIQNKWVSYKHKLQDLTFENYFLIHRWQVSNSSFYTEPELKRLHRVFGHPSVTALKNLLKRADPDNLSTDVKAALQDITKECGTCQMYAPKPRRFKVTVGTDDLMFNHVLAVDIMYINKKPVIHCVDEATHYQAALFLRRITAEDTWKAILRCWFRVYLGPPDHLRIDQGSNFVSKQFRDSVYAEGITLLEAPIECPSTMSNVERYHAPLRCAYNKIRDTLPRTESDSDCLQMAVKAVNDTIGPEGLCPTLLVYGTLPRPLRRTPADTQIRRAEAVSEAMKEIRKEQAKRKIAFALRHPGGPKAKEHEQDLQRLPAGAPVLVYRENSKKWEGPFPFVTVDGSTVVVQMPTGRKIFRSNVVKSANSALQTRKWCGMDNGKAEREEDHENVELSEDQAGNHDDTLMGDTVFTAMEEPQDTNERRSDISKNLMHAMFGAEQVKLMSPSGERTFEESRKEEIQGLMDRGTFEIVHKDTVPSNIRVYGTRWVDCVKTVNGKEVEKSRLVAQNYRDKGATNISTKSPTVSRMGQRVAVASAAMSPSHTSYVRDISQAYIQSHTCLERLVYLKPPPEMELGSDHFLLARKPLYGIPESGLHWFITYQGHHVDILNMKACEGDPCVLYKLANTKTPEGLTVLQVDDAYGHGNTQFLDQEERESHRFSCKPRKLLNVGQSAQFNGTRISVHSNGVHTLDQSAKLRNVTVPKSKEDLVSVRAQIQYISSCTRPDLCSAVQLMASEVTDAKPETFKKMENIVQWCKETQNTGLKFVPLKESGLRLVLFTDASFANAAKMKSQMGFVLALVDEDGTANVIHYGSNTCNRVTRSVMAAELLALVYGFDNAYVLQHMLQEVLNKRIPIDAYIDSKTVFNVIARKGPTVEKRLQIDAFALRESHTKGELRSLAWIEGSQNAADGLTKGLISIDHPLWKLMVSNKLRIRAQGWVVDKKDVI